jgi:multiple sugar transport system permease protein
MASSYSVEMRPKQAPRRDLRQQLLPEGWLTVVHWVLRLVLVAWALFALFPLYWGLLTSFKAPQDVATLPPSIVITRPSVENYRLFFQGVGISNAPVGRWFINSVLVTTATTLGTLLLASLAGYSFARKRFWGRDAIFWALIATMLIPEWSTIVPTYVLAHWLDMFDTYWVLILPGLASPFAVFLVRQFMLTLPEEIFQAAKVDGAGELQLWYRIALPLSKPVLGTLGVFVLVGSWNQFLWPLLVLNKSQMFTLLVGASTITTQIQGAGPSYGIAMAVAVIMSVVPVVAFLIMQRQLIRGLTIGGVKG